MFYFYFHTLTIIQETTGKSREKLLGAKKYEYVEYSIRAPRPGGALLVRKESLFRMFFGVLNSIDRLSLSLPSLPRLQRFQRFQEVLETDALRR